MIPVINIEDYTYPLPEERIAKYPLPERDGSRMLVYDRGRLYHRIFHDLPDLLSPGLLMAFNDTRVVQARLEFEKTTGSGIEIFCLEPYDPAEYSMAFQKQETCVWKCLVGNAKKWKHDTLSKKFNREAGSSVFLKASREGRDKNAFLVRFTWEPRELSFGRVLDAAGKTPIPPYLKRKATETDKLAYQTVYSQINGSVAAPTAGLHFTKNVLKKISDRGIDRINLTLHVGAGTFQPVRSGSLDKHPMHAERFYVSKRVLGMLAEHPGELLAVGTTTTRIIESLYWLGCKIKSGAGPVLFLDQNEAYQLSPSTKKESLATLLDFMTRSGSDRLEAVTRLMIVPGYSFRMTDLMITNFHMPGSTLLLLVGAFIGEDWNAVYHYALENGFRFLSYGDSSLLIPKKI